MKILILGASSYVGARLYFDLQKDFEVVGTYSSNKLSEKLIHLDVTNEDQVASVIETVKPDVIVHVANSADSRWCEANPQEAYKLNETSSTYIVDAANTIGVKIIYISSFAAMVPENVYSKTKKESEEIVKQTKNGWVILRPSLIVGYSPNTTNDRPFNRFLKNIDEGTQAEYDTSWKFQPTWLGHISEVIKLVLQRNIDGKIISIVVPELKTRYDLAKDFLTPFNVVVTSIDKHDATPVIEDDLETLKKLDLPMYFYKEIVSKIVGEIRERDKYKL